MLENTAPKRVFHYFEEICAIPHGSGNTDKISEYCVNFAEKHGLFCTRDSLNNVLIKKSASKGLEAHPPVILQGHLDMVCEKTTDCGINFATDGLKLELDGDLLSAEGTTLGADDGIAVAMILAILEDDTAVHPPIEALLTVDEETGMYGAEGFDTSQLSGNRLINLDSGEEGVLTVGCAGGAKAEFAFPISYEENTLPCLKITVSGLLGGHSGIDINKGRINADSLMGKLLSKLPCDFRLVSLGGGFKDNVIPSLCECVIATDGDISGFISDFLFENKTDTDSGLKITLEAVKLQSRCLDRASTARVTEFLCEFPTGVCAMSRDISGLVESSQNLGVIKIEGNDFKAVASVRSSVKAEKQALIDRLLKYAERFGAEILIHGDYPAWEYRDNSPLRNTLCSVFEKMYGKLPEIEAVHAGLECGLLSEKISDFDAVSMGPDMWDIHTVNERLSVSSVARVYEFLRNALKEL